MNKIKTAFRVLLYVCKLFQDVKLTNKTAVFAWLFGEISNDEIYIYKWCILRLCILWLLIDFGCWSWNGHLFHKIEVTSKKKKKVICGPKHSSWDRRCYREFSGFVVCVPLLEVTLTGRYISCVPVQVFTSELLCSCLDLCLQFRRCK